MIKKCGVKIIQLFFMILFFTGCSGKPAIQFTNLIHNFGTADEGKKVPHTFIFSNPGKETLIIEKVRPACGCTVTGKFEREVEPGKQGGIPILLDTTGLQGYITKTIRVETNVPDQKSYTLTIEGTIRAQVAVNPRTLGLGEVDEDTKSVNGVVTITNNMGNLMEITEIIPPNNKTEVKFSVIEQGKIYTLDITVKPPYKDGQVRETIIAKTNLSEKPEIKVHYSYFLPPILDVKPTEVYINPDNIAGETTREIYIYTSLGVPLEIANIDITSRSIEYNVEETNPGELYKIILRFRPGFTFPLDAPIYITFQIANAPDSPVFTVPIKDASTL